jgi:hypothetical protein
MNKEQLNELACLMKRLEEDHTVTIKLTQLNSIYGMVYLGCNDKYLMIINTNISYEKQLETIWHEAKHIYSHLGNPGDIKVFEKDAENVGKSVLQMKKQELITNRVAL